MTVVFVGRWGQKCGVSTYTEQLASTLQRADVPVMVLGPALCDEGDNLSVPPAGILHEYVWRRGQGAFHNPALITDRLKAAAAASSCGKQLVAHFQHEFGIWDHDEAFLDTLKACRSVARVVVTLHTVWPYGDPCHRPGWFERLGRCADVIITHTVDACGAVRLACRRGPAQVLCVPHGTPEERLGDRRKGRELFGLNNDGTLLLVQGMISPGKNVLQTIFSFCAALTRGLMPAPTYLAVSGHCYDPMYFCTLTQAIAATGYAPRIRLREGFVPAKNMPHVMAAADGAVLNSTSTTYSASGAAHAHAAHNVPLAVSAVPIYREAVEAGALTFDPGSNDNPTTSSVSAIAALCQPEVRDVIRNRQARWVAATRWSVLVPVYKEIYGC